jgi:hypothetical protein
MTMPSQSEGTGARKTFPVSAELFRQVYDSPGSLPGQHAWVTPDDEVREIERLLDIDQQAIGAPLWLSGEHETCGTCGRLTTWLDIVSSALGEVHRKQLIVQVILGHQKFVNVEAPAEIAGLACHQCGTPITDIRSFKCHNWAYAIDDLARIVEEVGTRAERAGRPPT